MRANQNCKDHCWFQTWCNKSHNYSSSYKPKKKLELLAIFTSTYPPVLCWFGTRNQPFLSLWLFLMGSLGQNSLPNNSISWHLISHFVYSQGWGLRKLLESSEVLNLWILVPKAKCLKDSIFSLCMLIQWNHY